MIKLTKITLLIVVSFSNSVVIYLETFGFFFFFSQNLNFAGKVAIFSEIQKSLI